MYNNNSRRFPSSIHITSVYLLFGTLYVILSNKIVFGLVDSPNLQTQIHMLKAWWFVAVSGILIYGMTRQHQSRYQSANAELSDTVQQVHILHRLLRHNLRNKCNIILGNADRILTNGGVGPAKIIKEQTNELVELSEKTSLFQESSIEDPPLVKVDLVPMVTNLVEEFAESHPDAEVQADFPSETNVMVHPRFRSALHELVLNGITHSGGKPVKVSVDDQDKGSGVSVRVIDVGSGLPPVEREVLAEGFLETPTKHSQGVGLWIVRYLVSESGGSMSVETGEDGTTIEIRLQEPPEGAIDKFLQ